MLSMMNDKNQGIYCTIDRSRQARHKTNSRQEPDNRLCNKLQGKNGMKYTGLTRAMAICMSRGFGLAQGQ